jgi:hypothetical protein
METSVFRVSEERPAPGVGRVDRAWKWLRRHRWVVMWGVVLTLGTQGLRELYDLARSWAAGDDASVGRELKDVPMYFIAAWGVYRRPAVWGRPLVWWIWHQHPEAKAWWENVSMSGRDWLGVALHVVGLCVFTAACLALRRLYADEHAAGEGGAEK